jgi:hypothetical protein
MPCASATNRGVKIKLLVSNWNLEALPQVYLKVCVCPMWKSAWPRACGQQRLYSVCPRHPQQDHGDR